MPTSSGGLAAYVLTLAHDTATANVTTSGTTFGTGADLLAAALSFTADGSSTYLLRCIAPQWYNSGTGASIQLDVNLDGADAGVFARYNPGTANLTVPLNESAALVGVAAGAHTINARLIASGGTAVVQANVGGAGQYMPIYVAIGTL